MSRNLIRILADMVDAMLDSRNTCRYDSDHEVPSLREEVSIDAAVLPTVLLSEMPSEGASHTSRPEEEVRQST